MKALDQQTADQIRNADPFVFIPHEDFAGSEGEAHLLYAISLDKHVVVWRGSDSTHIPIPDALADYGDYIIVDGTAADCVKAVKQYWEAAPGDEVIITSKGYWV